jgi:putative nucleotidyltransferase with HDIG domain
MSDPSRNPLNGTVSFPRMAWAFILVLTVCSVTVFFLLLKLFVPSGNQVSFFLLIGFGFILSALLLVGVLLLHQHYVRAQKRMRKLLEQELEYMRIEQESSEIIMNLNELLSEQTEEQVRLNRELRQLFLETVRAMVATLEARDEYTQNHSLRVAGWAELLGRYAGRSPEELEVLERGALLHDIGKVGIPDNILNKPGRLTEQEYEVVKTHPSRGDEIVKNIKMLQDSRPIIRHHHERPDGKGYPDGKADPPAVARVTSIADCFDAMTSQRPYRDPMDYDTAKRTMVDASGAQFDRELLNDFFEMLETTSEGHRSIGHITGIPPLTFSEENDARLKGYHERFRQAI